MTRFGRSEMHDGGIVWSVYEAAEAGDFKNGTRVASFLRERDAAAFAELVRPWGATPQPRIETPCPACGARSVFIGAGGHLTCAVIGCPDPGVEHVWSALTHTAGRVVMALLQADLATARQAARDCKVEFDKDGPFVRRWWAA